MTKQESPGDLTSVRGSQSPAWVRPALIVSLVIAAVLRLWGIDFGLPYEGITYDQLTWEEVQEVHRAFKLGVGEYAWRFGKGGLYYLLFVEYGIYYVVSLALGWVSNPREFAMQVLEDRTAVYMMGRLTVLLMGLATYVVIYSIGKRLYDWRVGLTAAIIGCAAYFHGVFSTVINVDIGMTLALWASLLAYLQYERSDKRRFLVFAGMLGAVAIAFKLPGAVILPLLFMAIVSAPERWRSPTRILKEGTTVFVTLLITLTVIAPEWITGIGQSLSNSFSGILGVANAQPAVQEDLDSAIATVTIKRVGGGLGYIKQLFWDYNVALTIAALVGIGIGLYRKHRWDIIWSVFIVTFVGVMSISDRSQSAHYMLPIMPALWLMGSRALVALSRFHWSLTPAALACVVAVPLISLVRHDVEKSHPDTRLLAKEWIEANVPSGAKLLMDGMQYRFIPSPPLNPDKTTVARQVGQASEVGEDLGRGVSDFTLSLYREALEQVEGPTYELHSTTYGLDLKDPSYYIENCFDYIVTSSYITERFAPGRPRRELFPHVAPFYEALPTDPRFRLVYEVTAIPWKSSGPTITMYEVVPDC